MPRPICVHCGKAYGQRNTTEERLQWFEGEERPAYRGNGVVVAEKYHGKSMSRETFRALRMKTPNNAAQIDDEASRLPERVTHTGFRTVWDGESYFGGYRPFCTLRCALDYARAAYNGKPIRRKGDR